MRYSTCFVSDDEVVHESFYFSVDAIALIVVIHVKAKNNIPLPTQLPQQIADKDPYSLSVLSADAA